MSRPGIDPIADAIKTESPLWRLRVNASINRLITGANAIDELTLTANAGSTTYIHPLLTYYSHVSFMPMTANAAGALAGLYVPQATMKNGECVITHANNAQVDKTFRVKIDG